MDEKDKRGRLVNCLFFGITFSVLRAEQIVSSETHSTRSKRSKRYFYQVSYQVYIGVLNPHIIIS